VAVALFLLAISAAIARYALQIRDSGKSFQALELAGIAVCFFGGCFDPLNWLWTCLPFTKTQIAEPARFAALGWVIIGIGWVVFVVGMIGKYSHP